MSTENTQSLYNFSKNKDKEFTAQLNRVYNALKENSYTTLEVAKATNILRANVCRHINTLLLQNTIAVIRQRKCSITGYPYVKEYTANPSLFPKSNQYTLFE